MTTACLRLLERTAAQDNAFHPIAAPDVIGHR